MEELEEAISTDLRNDIKDGKSADEIEADGGCDQHRPRPAVEVLQG